MTNGRVEVVICLGSSCFARGNKGLLRIISDYINEHGLKDRVHFHGGHCFGSCADGPVLKVGDTLHTHVDYEKALQILMNTFDSQPNFLTP